MSYHFGYNQLKVFERFIKNPKNQELLKKTRIIMLEHILPTTENMIRLLKMGGAEIFAIIAKPYSIDKKVLKSLLQSRENIIQQSYESLETTEILDCVLIEALKKSREDNKKILIIDVGGYFAKPFIRIQSKLNDYNEYYVGIIEDTTFGHNRYNLLKENINIPIFSVARSSLKEIEARFVGRDAIIATDQILRNSGVLMSGRHALVIGYGMIGKNVALALKNNHLNVSVYDKFDLLNLAAYIDGYVIGKKNDLIKKADIIFSTTGNLEGALSYNEIECCRNNTVLVSVGSKNTEFDIVSLALQAVDQKKINNYLYKYVLTNEKNIYVANEGTAVNFILSSLPVEVLDLVFSEILSCCLLLLQTKKKESYDLHVMHNSRENDKALISKYWLNIANS